MSKYLSYFILIICFSVSSQAQESFMGDVILYDGKGFHEWRRQGLISDYVAFGEITYYLEIVDRGYKKQFFRITDSLYHFRSYSKGHNSARGILVLSDNYVRLDTVIQVCPEEVVKIRGRYELLKHDYWKFSTAAGEVENGRYDKGEKVGEWVKRTFNGKVHKYTYEKDQIISATNPESSVVEQFIDSLRNKDFYLDSLHSWDDTASLTFTIKRTEESISAVLDQDANIRLLINGEPAIKYNLLSYSSMRNKFFVDACEKKYSFKVDRISENDMHLKLDEVISVLCDE